MADKLRQPNIEPITNSMYQLMEDFSFEWVIGDIKTKITVPNGFRYDGASVPRIFWTISGIRPDGLHRAASLVHDYIYFYEGKLPPGVIKWKYIGDSDSTYQPVSGKWSRKDADKLFRYMMLLYKEPNANIMYMVSRIGGFFYWREL